MEKIKDLTRIARAIGNCQDFIQGGGGNISAKTSDREMTIKASGCLIKDMDSRTGLVGVDYQKLLQAMLKPDEQTSALEDNDFSAFIINNYNDPNARPSMEAGFHSALNTFVLHSHSVYANIVNCSKEGKQIINKIQLPVAPLIIKYLPPGFELSQEIIKKADQYKKECQRTQKIIFLFNHGLIITTSSVDEALDLHQAVNEKIKKYFKITGSYPSAHVERKGNKFISNSKFVQEFINKHPGLVESYRDKILFPDQVVYLLGENVVYDIKKGVFAYQVTSESKALATEETLISWCYIISKIRELGLELSPISELEGQKIKAMPSEKYRQTTI